MTIDKILTREAFINAIATNAAIGGSTNAVVHLLAIAGRMGIKLTLDVSAATNAYVCLHCVCFAPIFGCLYWRVCVLCVYHAYEHKNVLHSAVQVCVAVYCVRIYR